MAQRSANLWYLPSHGAALIACIVNTRCIYHRLSDSRSSPDNVTLCPLLDFANHAIHPPHMLPEQSNAHAWDTAPRHKLGDSFTLLSPQGTTVQTGQELFLQYGAHANRTLFVEYGFVDRKSPDSACEHWEVDVQDIVEDLFSERGKTGSWMKTILEEEGYWGCERLLMLRSSI